MQCNGNAGTVEARKDYGICGEFQYASIAYQDTFYQLIKKVCVCCGLVFDSGIGECK